MEQTTQTFQLPLGVVSKVDVGRLLREIDTLDNFMRSAEARKPGTAIDLPKTSKLLDELLEINKKSALKNEDREEVANYLNNLRASAPILHMSFSADPSPLFTQRLIAWLRQNIHPSLLLQVGLQPTIGAGTIVLTTNKYFDFSLREYFATKKALLLDKMRNLEVRENNKPSEASDQSGIGQPAPEQPPVQSADAVAGVAVDAAPVSTSDSAANQEPVTSQLNPETEA